MAETCEGCKYLASKSETAGCEVTLFCNRLSGSAGPHGIVLGDGNDDIPERCSFYDDSTDDREWRW